MPTNIAYKCSIIVSHFTKKKSVKHNHIMDLIKKNTEKNGWKNKMNRKKMPKSLFNVLAFLSNISILIASVFLYTLLQNENPSIKRTNVI